MKTLIKNNVKGLFILLPMLVLLFSAMQVRAEEEKYYPKYREDEYIAVRGEKILENCFLKKSVVYGSKDGKIIFDLDNNRITFDNFKDEGVWSNIYQGYFAISFNHAEVMDMEIILKGNNEITISGENGKAISLTADAHFKGPGTLTVNGTMQCISTMTVENCDITINSQRCGLDVEKLEIYNSDIDATTTSTAIHKNAFSLSHVIMENSTLRGTSKRAYINAPRFDAQEMGEYFFNIDEVLTRKTGEIFVDDDGNTLYPVRYKVDHIWYFAFTKDVEAFNRDIPANIALTVNIASPARLEQCKIAEQVEEKIAAIGTVTAESGERIQAARNAYDNLEENIRYKIKNIDVLEEAEKAYRKINQKEADKVIAMIKGLGTITSDSGSKMDAVEKAYESLTADQKKLVNNYKDMEKARLKFQEAVDQRGQDEWLMKQERAAEGIRGLADGEFSKLQVSDKAKEVGVKKAVSNKKGTLTLEWKKEKKCSGYQIVCSRKKDFKGKNTITILIKDKKQTSYTFKKLTSKKNYFVKIRSYKVVNKEKQYGKWSKVKRVKVK